jgi:hypothetical protein
MNKTDTPIDRYLNGQEFHEFCMDYRAASPALANDCYIRLQDSIRAQVQRDLSAAQARIKELEGVLRRVVPEIAVCCANELLTEVRDALKEKS